MFRPQLMHGQPTPDAPLNDSLILPLEAENSGPTGTFPQKGKPPLTSTRTSSLKNFYPFVFFIHSWLVGN
jgi:hypothetical protein